MPQDSLTSLGNILGGVSGGLLAGISPHGQGGNAAAESNAALNIEKFNAEQNLQSQADQGAQLLAPGLAKLLADTRTDSGKLIADALLKDPVGTFRALGGQAGLTSVMERIRQEAGANQKLDEIDATHTLMSDPSFDNLSPQEQFKKLEMATNDPVKAKQIQQGISQKVDQLDGSAAALVRQRLTENYKPFRDQANQYFGLVDTLSQAPNAIRDLSAVTQFMHVIDPNSAVLLAEASRVEGAKPSTPWGWMAYTINRLSTGQTLTDDQRKQIVGAARDLMHERAVRQNTMEAGDTRWLSKYQPQTAGDLLSGIGMTPQDKVEFGVNQPKVKVITDEGDLPPELRP